MLRNLFLTSFRSLFKNKSTFLLNMLALTIGISGCIMAYLHISFESSYDRFHSNESRIFRVVTGDVANQNGWVKVSTPIPPKLKADLPEVESYARLTKFSYNEKIAVEYNKTVFNEENFFLADPALFSMFDFETVLGRIPEVPAANSVFISNEMASKYFQREDPIGKLLKVDGKIDFQVTGVFAKLPSNSHFDIDFVVPFENLPTAKPGSSLTSGWGMFNYFAYVLLEEGADPIISEGKMKEITAEYGDDQSMQFEELALQALKDIHFQPNRGNLKPSYQPKYLTIYSAVALAILIISFINFINLSVASSTRRIKEVGVRKVMGASKTQLVAQFVSESIITTTVASILALLFTDIALPAINSIIQSNMVLSLANPLLIVGIVTLIATIALFSGLYIALYILSFNPVNAVKGVFKIGNKGRRFKESLMIVQFSVSCILILASIFMYRQLTFLKDKDIGLDRQGIVTMQLYDQESQGKIDLLIPELEKVAGIQKVSGSRFTPGVANWRHSMLLEGFTDEQAEEISWNLISVDKNFVETFGIELVEGDLEDIKELSTGQKYTYIVNQAAVMEADWETGLGKSISPFGRQGYAPIAGVVKDFNYKSLHIAVEPCVLVMSDEDKYSQVSIKYSSQDPLGLLGDVETKFAEVMPNTPFEYAFTDDQFNSLYKVENQTSQLIGLLTAIAIVLALLGVYALLSFTIKERTKEIAIRKVLGIKMKGTLYLLSGNYIKLLVIGNLIGIPITWYIMGLWLQNFSYQISLGFVTFLGVAISTFLLILVVVGFKVAQIENINPTDALHYE
ncbi:MAG: FtsX-like permease family protein [Cyclobacteriaceae bacterium]